MKISHEMQNTKTETNFPRMQTSNPEAFQQILKSEGKEIKQQELQQLLDKITEQGNRLARCRSFQDLAKFKRLIQEFLKRTVSHGYRLDTAHSFGFNGQNRQLKLVKEVDQKLLELTEEVMGQEKKSVKILELVGELKGLLINIYQ
jgi:uncharacterized protein YaaR (DUF327 family)